MIFLTMIDSNEPKHSQQKSICSFFSLAHTPHGGGRSSLICWRLLVMMMMAASTVQLSQTAIRYDCANSLISPPSLVQHQYLSKCLRNFDIYFSLTLTCTKNLVEILIGARLHRSSSAPKWNHSQLEHQPERHAVQTNIYSLVLNW